MIIGLLVKNLFFFKMAAGGHLGFLLFFTFDLKKNKKH